nr:MAG TPA: DNA repair exonuclease [Caudoviricetes sp.]
MRNAIEFITDIDSGAGDIIFSNTIVSAHISDIHFPVMDPRKQYDILCDQFIYKLQLLNQLNLVCINGDLFDHKVMTSSDATYYASLFIAKLVELCKDKNATLIILQGTISHDNNQIKMYYHYMERMDVDVRIVTNIQFETVKYTRILCIPEFNNLAEEIYDRYLNKSGFYDMCIMHGNFKGAVYEDSPSNSRIFTIDDFINCRGPIISGHIHKPGCHSGHFYYCGSPYRWRFDDDHDKGFILMVMDTVSRNYQIENVPIISDSYKTIHLEGLINDAKDTIDYIEKYKKDNLIDNLRIKFAKDIDMTSKMILNNYFRDRNDIVLIYYSNEKELQETAEHKIMEQSKEYWFLLDNSMTDMQKFIMWVNSHAKDDNYITEDELTTIMSS